METEGTFVEAAGADTEGALTLGVAIEVAPLTTEDSIEVSDDAGTCIVVGMSVVSDVGILIGAFAELSDCGREVVRAMVGIEVETVGSAGATTGGTLTWVCVLTIRLLVLLRDIKDTVDIANLHPRR